MTSFNDSVSGDTVVAIASGDDITLHYDRSIAESTGKSFSTELLANNQSVIGSNQADSVGNETGDTSGATIHGNGGNDFVNIFGSYYLVTGDSGDDYLLSSGSGVYTTVMGGNGNDTLDVASRHALVQGDDGNDRIFAETTQSTFDGGAGQDKMDMYASTYTTLTGGSGNDTLQAYTSPSDGPNAHDLIDAGTGNDSVLAAGSQLTVLGGTGSDTIAVGGSLYGNSFAKSDHVTVDGGSGSDSIFSAAHSVNLVDSISGGDGNDIIAFAGGHSTIDGGNGADSITAYGTTQSATIDGGIGNDTIMLANNPDSQQAPSHFLLDAGDGNDSVMLNGDHHVVLGGQGADTITFGNLQSATVDGGSDADRFVFTASQQSDTLRLQHFEQGSDRLDVHALKLTSADLASQLSHGSGDLYTLNDHAGSVYHLTAEGYDHMTHALTVADFIV